MTAATRLVADVRWQLFHAWEALTDHKTRHMKTDINAILLCTLLTEISLVHSCGQTEKIYYCKSYTHIKENRCPKVEPVTCSRYTLRCACGESFYRNKDLNCVSLSKCDAVLKEAEQKRKEHQIRKEKVYEHTLKVIQGRNDLDLLYISTWTWMNTVCYCLKSKLREAEDNGAYRTVECYAFTEIRTRPDTAMEAMTKSKQTIFFKVEKEKQFTSILLTTTNKYPLPFDLEREYLVLAAAKDCLLLKVGDEPQGKALCMLWGVDSNETKDDAECFSAMERECTKYNSDVWSNNDRCVLHDELANGVRRKPRPKQRRRRSQRGHRPD